MMTGDGADKITNGHGKPPGNIKPLSICKRVSAHLSPAEALCRYKPALFASISSPIIHLQMTFDM